MSERKILRHMVMFGFLSNTDDRQVGQVIDRFTALKHSVPGIVAFE